MDTKIFKKVISYFLVFAIMFSTSITIFNPMQLSAASEAETAKLNNSISGENETSSTAENITIGSLNIPSEKINSTINSNDIVSNSTNTHIVSSTPVATCMPSGPTDTTAPQFSVPSIEIYMPEGGMIDETRYMPEGTTYETEEGPVTIPPAATDDIDSELTYELILGDGFNNDGSDAPGHYVIYSKATDDACNSTEMPGEGVLNPHQIIEINILPMPTVYAAQDNFSTKVDLEFVYDRSLYPDYAEAMLVILDENNEEIDTKLLDINTTELKYDQGNYEDYTYFYSIYIGTEDFINGQTTSNMIQLPEIKSFSTQVEQGSKLVNINYDVLLHDFPYANVYLEVNGEYFTKLDSSKHSITYKAPEYGTYDVELFVDYSESADSLTKTSSIEVTAPSKLAYSGLELSWFDSIILSIQEFIMSFFD